MERGLRDPASRVVGELRGMCVRIGDREQVVFGVVGVLRGVARRVGDRGQAVGVVVSVGYGLAILIGRGDAASA